jgi:hypothetical protein
MIGFLRRQRYLLEYSLSSLARRPGKHLGLVLVYATIVFLLASTLLFTQSLRQEAALVLAESPELIVQRLLAGRHDLIPASYLEPIGAIRGIGERYGRLWGYFYDPAVRANYTLMVPREDPPAAGEVQLGAGVARARGLGPGDYLSLRSARGEPFSFRIAVPPVRGHRTGLQRPHAAERGGLPPLLRLPRGPLHRYRAAGPQPGRGAQGGGKDQPGPAGYAAHPARGDTAHLRRRLRLASGPGLHPADRGPAGLRHLSPGTGPRG